MGMEMEQDDEERKLAPRRAEHFFNLVLHHQTTAVTQTLMDFPEAIRWRYPGDQTPLMCAVRQGYNDIAEILLKAGAPTSDAIDSGWTAFIYAGRDNNPAAFDMLIAHGSSVKEKGKNGDTALTQAIEGHHTFAALRLIELGADIEAVTWTGRTPLLEAAYDFDAPLCAALVRAGANLDAIDSNGKTALDIARRCLEPGFDDEKGKGLATLRLLEAAFADKAECERLALREKLGNEMGQGTGQPVAVGPTLKLKQRKVPSP